MTFCVDGDVFLAARTAVTILFVDLDFFSVVVLAVESRVSRFVAFPSETRSTLRKVGLSLYSDASSLSGSVVPVRRREEAKRDRDSGVKVQIDWSEGVPSRMPFEPLRQQFERITRNDSCSFEVEDQEKVMEQQVCFHQQAIPIKLKRDDSFNVCKMMALGFERGSWMIGMEEGERGWAVDLKFLFIWRSRFVGNAITLS